MNNIIMKPGSEKITKFGILKSVLDSDSNHLFNDEYNMYDWNIEPEKCSKCCFNKISCNVEDFQPMVSKTKFLGIEKETNTTYYFFCSEMPNEQSEVLSIFPEYTEYFNFVEEIFLKFKNKILLDIEEIRNLKFNSKKEFAERVIKTQLSPFFFNVFDGKMTYDDLNIYLLEYYGSEKIVNLLKIKDKIYNNKFEN